jgi:uncharacterized protein (DUF58 family)
MVLNMTLDARDIVDPAFFSRLENLELRARSVVEGFLQGLHRSPFVGFSVEFASHRQYVPGDDLRHVNWKLYSRQKRLYVKEFDAETNMNLYVLLDISNSMQCANAAMTKLQYGATLAAAVTHLALKQRDAVGLILFADSVVAHVPPRCRPDQLAEILRTIATTTVRPVSNASRSLHPAAELARHRGMVVIISDLLDDLAEIMSGIDHFRFRNHEVIIFHVLDPWERSLPVDGNFKFRDMETGDEVIVQVEGIREDYLQAVQRWRQSLDRQCRDRAVDRIELTTVDPLDRALLDYLATRSKAY